jgi:hypothetical protein
MQVPLDLVYHHTGRSPSCEALIRQQAQKLHRYAPDLVTCRVIVEQPGQRRHHGNVVRIRIEATLAPHHQLVASEATVGHSTHDRVVMPLVRRAFAQIARQIDAYAEIRRGVLGPRRTPLPPERAAGTWNP